MSRHLALLACGILAITIAGCAMSEGTRSTLTQAAELACRGQASANLAGVLAAALGNNDAAESASKVSVLLGMACTW